MSEGKRKKKLWLPWALGAAAFIAVIGFLLYQFTGTNKESAKAMAQAQVISLTDIWAEQVSEEIQKTIESGNILRDMATRDGLGLTDKSIVALAAGMTDNTGISNVLMCRGGKVICNEKGEAMPDYDLKFLTSEDRAAIADKCIYLSDNGIDSSKVLAIPFFLSDDSDECFVLMLSIDAINAKLKDNDLSVQSFLVLLRKDGTICTPFKKFSDEGSAYIKSGNFLSNVTEGSTGKETYNIFKTKMYNGITGAIDCNFSKDERTIVCSAVDSDDLYIAYGVRKYQIDKLVAGYYAEARSVSIKLAIVITFFALFLAGYGIFDSFKTREKGKKLEDKADTDLLTELYNKAATERKIEEYIEENPDGRALMFILDIDNFKKVNDTMGHAFGDTLLKTLGKEIRTEFRLTDIVGRTGGDEFIIFLKDVKDNLIVEREANRLTRFFHDFKAGGDYVKYSATASIGAVIYPDDARSFKDLYVAADQALYRAKKRGKNQLVFYNEDREA